MNDDATNETGPRAMAGRLETLIGEMEATKAACPDPAEKRRIQQRIKMQKGLLRWCKTRVGY